MNLFPHQKEALDQTEDKSRCAYYLDMGLGKTFIGSEKMFRLGAKVNLVICQKSKVNDWVEHFRKNYPSFIVFDATKLKQIVWNTMFNKMIEDAMEHAFPHVYVINYELAWRRKELLKLHDFTLMLDESSLIQNPKAKQTKFVLKMEPANVILLSGTPTGGKYENLWSQMHLLGWDISEHVYDTQYVNWKKIVVGGMVHKIVDMECPYKNVERLKTKMREHGAVFMKTEEVMELPEQNFIEIKVPTTPEYKKFVKNRIVEVNDHTFAGDTIFNFRLYQRMLCGAFNHHKLEAFEDLLKSTHDRLVVFYNFNSELLSLAQICEREERPVSVVNGSCKDLGAYENDPDSVTLVQYRAGGMGINLQKANKIVYFSPTESSELFEQSKKRIHRIGQDMPCFYYIMECEHSIEDEEIIPTLGIRKEYTDELFKENIQHGSSDGEHAHSNQL